MEPVSAKSAYRAQSVELIKEQRSPYISRTGKFELDISEQRYVVIIADVVLIEDLVHQHVEIAEVKAFGPDCSRSEINMKVLEVRLEHCNRIRILKKACIRIIS